MAENTKVTLNCIVKESPESIFKVTVDKKEDVLMLKDAIKEKLPDTFRNVDTIGIKVWFVHIAQDDERLEQLGKDNRLVESVFGETATYETRQVLFPVEHFLGHFKNTGDDKAIYVIVQGKEKWCSVCDKPFSNDELLEGHEFDSGHIILSGGESVKVSRKRGDEDNSIPFNFVISI